MIAKTAHWGNSIGVRIPSAVAKKAGIGVNSTVEINQYFRDVDSYVA